MLDNKNKAHEGPIYDLAVKYFETYKQEIHQVWYEQKMDIYYCRTVSGEYWQIPLSDLRNEIKILKLDNN